MDMSIPKEVMDRFDKKWHTDIFLILEGEETSEEFLVFLNSDEEAQKNFELLFSLVNRNVESYIRNVLTKK